MYLQYNVCGTLYIYTAKEISRQLQKKKLINSLFSIYF